MIWAHVVRALPAEKYRNYMSNCTLLYCNPAIGEGNARVGCAGSLAAVSAASCRQTLPKNTIKGETGYFRSHYFPNGYLNAYQTAEYRLRLHIFHYEFHLGQHPEVS